MIDALAELIVAAFGVVIASLLPVFVLALVAALAVGLLCGALGLRDGVLASLLRTLAVVLAIAMVVEQIAAATLEFATTSWAGLDGLPARAREGTVERR